MASRKKFSLREGTRCSIPAHLVGRELERIRRDNDGSLMPEQIIEEARAKDNPLHEYFQWDNTKAAVLYRLQQARQLIVSVRVIEPTDSSGEARPAYLNVRARSNAREYRAAFEVMGDDELRNKVVARAYRELQGWKRRYSEIKELAETVDLIAGVLRKARR